MLKVTYCMRRLPQLSREEFQTYYRKNHPRVLDAQEGSQLGIRRYVQLHALPEEDCDAMDMGRGGEPSFDAVAEIWLDDHETLVEQWYSEAGRTVLQKLMADEQKFVDWSRSVMFCSREMVLIDGPTTSAPQRG